MITDDLYSSEEAFTVKLPVIPNQTINYYHEQRSTLSRQHNFLAQHTLYK